MSAPLSTTAIVLLALLARRPAAGHELAAFVDRSVARFWPIPRSQVYRELPRLEEAGLLRGEHVAQADAPDKRVYTVTAEGRAAVRAWLEDPAYPAERVRNGLLVKLFFGADLGSGVLGDVLERFRKEAAARAQELDAITQRLASVPPATHQRLTALYGLRRAQMELAWAEEVEQVLAGREA